MTFGISKDDLDRLDKIAADFTDVDVLFTHGERVQFILSKLPDLITLARFSQGEPVAAIAGAVLSFDPHDVAGTIRVNTTGAIPACESCGRPDRGAIALRLAVLQAKLEAQTQGMSEHPFIESDMWEFMRLAMASISG